MRYAVTYGNPEPVGPATGATGEAAEIECQVVPLSAEYWTRKVWFSLSESLTDHAIV